jgi:hypothetical protein
MRSARVLVAATVFLLAAIPSFAATTCTLTFAGPYSWYQCIKNDSFFPGTTSWSVSPSGNVDTTHSGQQMCSSGWTHFAKSTGAYGFATLDQSFTTDSMAKSSFGINLTVDLLHSHSSSANRLSVIVYNLTDNTAEVIATIDSSAGDICSTTYTYSVSRPAWVGKNLKLRISEAFLSSDAQINLSGVSFIQNSFP